ncbi:hypothetical protein ABQF35_11050 [Mycobacterium syngnathidarum]
MTYPPPQSDPGPGQTPDGYSHGAAIPRAPAKASHARRVRTVTLVVGAILVSVVAVAAVTGWVDLERLTGGHPASAAGQLTGDRNEWSAAVCADGTVSTISDGKIGFPNVQNYASCMSRVPGSGGGVVPILIGEWNDKLTMRQDLMHYKAIRSFASGERGDAVIVFAPIGDTGTAPLGPLAEFGFGTAPLP